MASPATHSCHVSPQAHMAGKAEEWSLKRSSATLLGRFQ